MPRRERFVRIPGPKGLLFVPYFLPLRLDEMKRILSATARHRGEILRKGRRRGNGRVYLLGVMPRRPYHLPAQQYSMKHPCITHSLSPSRDIRCAGARDGVLRSLPPPPP